MKKLTVTILMLAAALASSKAQEVTDKYLPQWQEGYLDIHTIATGDGDSSFLVFPDGTTMLIDCGDIGSTWPIPQFPNDSRTVGEWVVNYINVFSKGTPNPGRLDYMFLTHLHSDHMGEGKTSVPGEHGFRRSGLTMVGDLIPVGKIIDRGYPEYDFPSKEKNLKACRFLPDYKAMIEYQISEHGASAEQFQIGSRKQFAPVYNARAYRKNFEILNISANACVWTGKGYETRKMYTEDPAIFDENMFSTAFRLTYGDFRYYNGGDTPGGTLDRYEAKDRNFERFIGPVCGKVTAMKLDHHGWEESSNAGFMLDLSPEVIIAPCCNDCHPAANTMKRLTDPFCYDKACEFYITADEPGQLMGEELWSHFKPSGHIVIRVYEGGHEYQVYVLEKTAEDYHVIYQTGRRKVNTGE